MDFNIYIDWLIEVERNVYVYMCAYYHILPSFALWEAVKAVTPQ